MQGSNPSDIKATGGFLPAGSSLMCFKGREASHRRPAHAVAIRAAVLC
jgi:hypothetical protein